jgi:hypothetical protein
MQQKRNNGGNGYKNPWGNGYKPLQASTGNRIIWAMVTSQLQVGGRITFTIGAGLHHAYIVHHAQSGALFRAYFAKVMIPAFSPAPAKGP